MSGCRCGAHCRPHPATRAAYFRSAQGILLVYDVTQPVRRRALRRECWRSSALLLFHSPLAVATALTDGEPPSCAALDRERQALDREHRPARRRRRGESAYPPPARRPAPALRRSSSPLARRAEALLRAPRPRSAQILIGNKCDDEANRKIPTARGAELAAEYGMKFFETSAKARPQPRADARCRQAPAPPAARGKARGEQRTPLVESQSLCLPQMGINVEKAFMEIATDVKRTLPGGSVDAARALPPFFSTPPPSAP